MDYQFDMVKKLSFHSFLFTTLICVVCLGLVGCPRQEVYLENVDKTSIPAAIDLGSCAVLANEHLKDSAQVDHMAYLSALRSGAILQIPSGTVVEQLELLNFTNGHMTSWKPTGPISVAEENRLHIGEFTWVLIQTGPNKGKRVCVFSEMLHGKYAPL